MRVHGVVCSPDCEQKRRGTCPVVVIAEWKSSLSKCRGMGARWEHGGGLLWETPQVSRSELRSEV